MVPKMNFASNTSLFLTALTVLAFVVLTTCGKDSPTKPQAPDPPQPPPPAVLEATRIVITMSSVTMSAIGETVHLTARVFDQNSNVMSDASVTWQSSDTVVATVSAQGLVTAVGNGRVTITARSGNASATADVTVSQSAGSIAIEPVSATLMSLGETVQLTAIVLDGNGQPVADASVTWQSSDTVVATVSAQGLVTAVSNGRVTITARSGNASATAAVTVSQSAGSIAIEPVSATLMSLGETVQLTAIVLDGNGQPVADASVTWQSSDTVVATVSAQGLVTAVGNGRVTITARSGNASATADVTVSQSAGSIAIEPVSATLMSLGETVQLTAIVLDGNGQPVADASVTWQSSDTVVATVSAQGLVTAVSNGRVTITARSGNASATAAVTVSQSAGSIAIEPVSATLMSLGETVQLTAIVLDGNGQPVADASVTWQSSDTVVATVSAQGLVTAVGNGRVTITVHSGDLSGSSEIYVQGPDSDRAFLTAFYDALDGPNWINAAHWNSNTPLGQWHGVSTNAEDRVTALNLGNNGLSGVIPPEIGQLAALEGLALDGNRLTGSIPPEIGLLSNLKHLYLFSNQLTGAIPTELGNLENLLHMCLDRNRLSGSIPMEIGNLTNLKWLHLHNNIDLSGPLPESITGLRLSELLLHVTQACAPPTERFDEWLEGILDKQIAACGEEPQSPDRVALEFLYNATGGPRWHKNANWLSDVPLESWYGVRTRNGKVIGLSLGLNNLSGDLPPEIGELKNLTDMKLNGNELTSTIPPEIAQLQDLTKLDLHNNHFTGSIPPELGQLQNLTELTLHNSHFTGSIPPELGQLQNLTEMRLGGNGLIGSIPPELSQLQNLTYMSLSGNWLTGSIPPELGQLQNLKTLQLNGNRLTGSIPPELGQLQNLTDMRLGDGLTGSIPPELGSLINLEILSLSGNADMSGPLPATLTNLANLRGLYLTWTQLCIPSDEVFLEWLSRVSEKEGVVRCEDVNADKDRDALVDMFNGTGGPEWTNNTGWLSDQPLNEWHGITTGQSGRVEAIALVSNDLRGTIPLGLGDLTELRHLDIYGNPGLSGKLPHDLSDLDLESLILSGTALCIPDDEEFRAWFQQVSEDPVTICTAPSTDRESLIAFYHATGGNNWTNNTNWLSTQPLDQWHGVQVNSEGEVTDLVLYSNNLSNSIPPELGQLQNLKNSRLAGNQLTGSIPAELSQLQNLEYLFLSSNELSGSIPPELGRSQNLTDLRLNYNALTGYIPPELGQLQNLKNFELTGNQLTGSIPAELGQLTNLEGLYLADNQLTGSIPSELGQLQNLEHLGLALNRLTGPLPQSFTQLLNLRVFYAAYTGLCVPRNAELQAWLDTIDTGGFSKCPLFVDLGKSAVYLTQSVQSFSRPVPLVAEEPALLRVFLVSDGAVANKPAVQATFYHDGAIVHSVVIPSEGVKMPDQFDESSISVSSNVLVPGDVIRPGLGLIVEIGGEDEQFTGSGSMDRNPETGMIKVDVHDLPDFDLTMIPLLWSEDPDYSVVTQTEGLTAESDLFRLTRDLLPVQDFQLTVREPVFVSLDPVFKNHDVGLLGEVEAIRTMDGAGGYYMGVLRGGGGAATLSGVVSLSALEGDVIAHELGHNLSLGHAPCDKSGFIDSLDPAFPSDDGNIGAWGFDFLSNALVHPATPDLMSYCDPVWISDYHFGKMIEYRLTKEEELLLAAGPPLSKSLLLWGGLKEEIGLYLEPAFAVNAPPSLPREGGPYRLEGHGASGNALFELNFAMGDIADGEGGVFVFAIPVQQGWSGLLARITLTGPEGFVEMTRDSGRSAAILLDPSTGRVRGILRDWPELGASVVTARRVLPELGLDVVISRGIPDVGDW